MPGNDVTPAVEMEKEYSTSQEARAKLRDSFLRALNELYGETCNIMTYEQSTLKATFSGWNLDGSEVLVESLQTPAREIVGSALLRTPDILAIQFDKPLQLT